MSDRFGHLNDNDSPLTNYVAQARQSVDKIGLSVDEFGLSPDQFGRSFCVD
jgi:hypothetical protein